MRKFVNATNILNFATIVVVSLAPILALYYANIGDVSLDQILLPLFTTPLILAFIAMILSPLFNSFQKSGLFVTIVAIISLHYGIIIRLIGKPNIRILFLHLGEDKLMLLGTIAVFLILVIVLKKTVLQTKAIQSFILLIFGISLSINIFNIVSYEIKTNNQSTQKTTNLSIVSNITYENQPDIYYIILDRYAGEDSLTNYYNYDNNDFYNKLSTLGFYKIEHAYANYPSTVSSLASSLNQNYVDKFLPIDSATTQTQFYPLLSKNIVGATLKNIGYTYVQYGSWYEGTKNNIYADINLDSGIILSEFSQIFINQTIISPIEKVLSMIINRQLAFNQDSLHQLTIEKQIKALSVINNIVGPKFVFAHILLPHEPYIYDRECNLLSQQVESSTKPEKELYLNQVGCVNKLITPILENIISKSSKKPIIILQADEGPYPIVNISADDNLAESGNDTIKEKSNVLFYIFEPDSSITYPYRSPVNLFRYVFNKYFSANLDYLDEKFYMRTSKPYEFQEITNVVIN